MDKSKTKIESLTFTRHKANLLNSPLSIHKRFFLHALIVLSVLASIGMSQFRSYGISYDEPAMRMHGIATAKYVAEIIAPRFSKNLSANPIYSSIQDAANHQDGATHQVFFELGLVFMEYKFGLTYKKKNLYEYRHLATFLFCSLGLVTFFAFLYWRFRSLRLSYLGVFFVAFSPRIFSDMFYNNKDAVFMTTYLVAGVTSVVYIVSRSRVFFLLSAIAIGLSVSTRVIGVIPLMLIFISILFYSKDINVLRRIKKILLHTSFSVIFIVLFHPYYWSDPIQKLIEVFVTTARYPYRSCTLTFGDCLETTSLPWFYLPLWISVTVPVIFLVVFLFGILRSHFEFFSKFKKPLENYTSMKIDFLVLSLVILPLLIAVISKTTLYNGWRHFYFIYPFLSYFGVRYFSNSVRTIVKRLQLVLSILVVFTFVSTASWMYTNRPLQNLYFNQLAGEEIATNWELDYFCLSNRQALEWIVSRDPRESISIQTNDGSPLYDSAVFLSQVDVSRVNFLWYSAGIDEADYVIVRQDLNTKSRELRKILNSQESGFKLVYKKSIGQTEIFSIYARDI